jgi:murein DD-endopeptidase MepM/ murein hydrolase activator NlpD
MDARKLVFIIASVFIPLGAVAAQDVVHIMQKGETLYSLSRTYGVSYSSIISANKISDPNNVKAGQKVLIPKDAALRHSVAKGETLFGISQKYGLTVTELRALNKLSDKSILKAGDVLIVGKESKAASVVAAAKPESAPPAEQAQPRKTVDAPPQENVRSVTAKRNDPSLRWPVRAKELAYMEGKLYGVLLTGERAERVESLSAGTVVSAEPYRGFGRVAIVQSTDGHVYVYGGNETLSVKPGDRVAAGAELGRLGVDSLTGKPSLFFFVYKDNVAIDPAKAPRS